MFCHKIYYDLELLKTWKNYNKKRELLKLDTVEFHDYSLYSYKEHKSCKSEYERIKKYVDRLQQSIDTNDYNERIEIANSNRHYNWWEDRDKTVYEPPILKATGIGTVIDPLDIFNAIEEHLSMNRTEAERTEPLGATNNDKIIMHGFDTKSSFRGKV